MPAVLMRLYFRNLDGSPAFGGWWMIFVAAFIGVQAVLLILRPDLYLRLMVRGSGAAWLKLWGA